MSEILMAILLVYSTSRISHGQKVCRKLKMVAILKIFKYLILLQFRLRYEKIVQNYAKNIFQGDDVIGYVIGWPESCPLYLCLGEVVSGRNRLSGLYMPTSQQITRQDRRSKVKVTGLLGDLGTYYGNLNLVSLSVCKIGITNEMILRQNMA